MNSSPLEPQMPQPNIVNIARPPRSNERAAGGDTFDLWFATDFRSILRRRWLLLIAPVAVLLLVVLVFCLVRRPVYQSEAMVLLQWEQPAGSASASLGSAASVASLFGLSGDSGDLPTQIQLMQSDTCLTNVMRRLGIHESLEKMRKQIGVEPSKVGGMVVDVTVTASSPQLAQKIGATLIDEYEKESGAEDATVVGRSAALVRQQIAEARTQLAVAEDRLTAFSKRSGTIAPTTESEKRVAALYEIESDVLTAQERYSAASAQRDYYQQQISASPAAIVPTVTFQRDALIDEYKKQLDDLEVARAQLSQEYTPKDQQMIDNENEIDAVTRQIVRERQSQASGAAPGGAASLGWKAGPNYQIAGGTRELNPNRDILGQKLVGAQAEMEADQATLQAAKAAAQAARASFKTAPTMMRSVADLSDDVDVERRIYDSLRVQLMSLEAQRGTQQVYTRMVMDPDLPRYPEQPKPLLYSVVALAVGLLLGLLAMVAAESADRRFRTAMDVNMEIGLPVLAQVPRAGKALAKQGAHLFESDAPSAEIRRLASVLSYLGLGRTIRSLIVTSTVAGEGVSFTASQLALALSSEGRRVILVDANLRCPSLHTYFGLANSSGLAGAMRNGAHPEKALVQLKGARPLQLVPGGDLQNDPIAQLLRPEKLTTLLEALMERADVVLLDAPAIFDGMETAMLADKADAAILVTAIGVAERDDVREAVAMFEHSATPLIGVVLNEAAPKPRAARS